MTSLWKIVSGKLQRVGAGALASEGRLESWIANDPSILGLDIMLIGRQVATDYGGRIDLLGINRDGDLTIIELKRDRTPRDVVAQILDYASWIAKLTTKQVHDLANHYLNMPLAKAFREHFESPLPENLNSSHNMVIVAGSLDPSSRRIVEYLSEECGISINTAFFNVFAVDGQELITADWLLDQDEVTRKAEAKTKAPWTGVWYANVGDGKERSWEDMRKYGFLAAGGGSFYSVRLDQLNVDDHIFAYQKKLGYVGYGIVTDRSVMAKDFIVNGEPLLSLPLKQPNLAHDRDEPTQAEYVVRVDWQKTFSLADAKKFDGAFANQNVVCRLTHPQTLEFLKETFSAPIPI